MTSPVTPRHILTPTPRPGESCEERGRVFTACANGCPRGCADLWPHVKCLQGPCEPGMCPIAHPAPRNKP